jgi:TRAP-type C4-dicarboxylate transport system substrate-binding protein
LSWTEDDFADLETRMRRIAISLAALVACSAFFTAAAADPITLKFSQFLGPTSFFQADVVEPWAKEFEAKTNGQVKVEIFDGTSPLGKQSRRAM